MVIHQKCAKNVDRFFRSELERSVYQLELIIFTINLIMLLIDSLKLKIRSESKNQEKQTLEHFPVRHIHLHYQLIIFPIYVSY